ncbi:DUF5591 domain-containing protein [Metabacillus idriensis]|uniref:DUF5591 domain-containing protein n=1 Tax=Metabacillus idriensis TaxID=324768 RepID=UPI00174C40B5|nr:DUF5591 domain-containing protein [Metabacillus idriensis]
MRSRSYSSVTDDIKSFGNLNKRGYPNFNEYILIDLIKHNTVFKRGASLGHIHHDEFNIWQDYFCSDQYNKPAGKKIAFLQVCSWSKPYDFSYIGKKIRSVTDKYELVHPIILSNAGVIPYEYQMNPTFCSYDWIEKENEENLEELRSEFREVLLERIERYLSSNKYDVVVQYGIPSKEHSMAPLIKEISNKLGMRYHSTPDVDTYREVKSKLVELRDPGEFFCLDEVLISLDKSLSKVSKYVESLSGSTSV